MNHEITQIRVRIDFDVRIPFHAEKRLYELDFVCEVDRDLRAVTVEFRSMAAYENRLHSSINQIRAILSEAL